mmetsp:Transcript_20572/g.44617  ORF Transcript_20572/g.44617 Transcript_20572/m.44617 type:complete len:562 (+) Transcript_20572:322-2007(+)
MTMKSRKSITADDVITVNGRYLYIGTSNNNSSSNSSNTSINPERFFLKGIAFPTPPPNQRAANRKKKNIRNSNVATATAGDDVLDLSGWNAVLEQLAYETDINTIRVYEMDCRYDYSKFLERAAELGIYVIVPLTSRIDGGVLRRDAAYPLCFPRRLRRYGISCLERYWDHPNVLAGMVGNEVMNDLGAWGSAPCVKAYLNYLAARGRKLGERSESSTQTARRTVLPLMYATQHDSPVAEFHPDEAVKLTLDYLTCNDDGVKDDGMLDNTFIFGINIESWCSSLQSFEYEEGGTEESTYHSLWRTMAGGNKTKTIMDAVTGETTTVQVRSVTPLPVSIPVVFSEMGCSKKSFNRDNDAQPKRVRDWKQMSLVQEHGPMSDIFSGFVAYGYDGGGNGNFRMMGGRDDPPWDGRHPLPPSPDYDNFRAELSKNEEERRDSVLRIAAATTAPSNGGRREGDRIITAPSCHRTVATLHKAWGVDLQSISAVTSYTSLSQLQMNTFQHGVKVLSWSYGWMMLGVPAGALVVLLLLLSLDPRRRRGVNRVPLLRDTNREFSKAYGTC